ncbi:MAG: protein-L-isoaspartate O-methyltransferase [Gammaproteobacteria bacterium]|nr:protein-L-isoaspartate O-methyltransferase [Pseudomonadota bacterium]MCH9663587.1 protein-L-isoaspartate O-methyltransferase [Gammaproteobacteria bacterium]
MALTPQPSASSFIQQRANMIEQQVRPWSVLDDKVLGVMNDIPRENFVPEHFRALAYSETRIPLSCCQEMIPPAVAGRILQALEIKPRHRILEIGTGSGYISACLSRLGNKVTSIEFHEPVFNQARLNLARCTNVDLRCGDALKIDLPEADIVVVNASMAVAPERILNTIGLEGRALIVLGSADDPVMRATVIEMRSGNPLHRQIFDTWLPPLIVA